jgi:hypothetical protein
MGPSASTSTAMYSSGRSDMADSVDAYGAGHAGELAQAKLAKHAADTLA